MQRLRRGRPGSFDELSVAGQRRRVRLLALDAIAAWGLAPERTHVRRVGESFNTIFRVVEYGSEPRALRVGPAERIHAEGTEIVEARWMRDLVESGVVSPPAVFDTTEGASFVQLSRTGVPGDRTCMMFGWVRGTPLSHTMNAEVARELGALMALLHESAPAVGPVVEPPLAADRVLYWRLENRLPELGSAGTLLQEALDRAQRYLDEIWARPPHDPRLLHGDLTASNVLNGPDGLVPIDFQDLVWGFDIQDVAITLKSFAHFRQPGALHDAFRCGYASIRTWPDVDESTLAALIAARRLNQLNLALALRRPGLDEYVERAHRLIAQWMT